jgi:hypothetical protein
MTEESKDYKPPPIVKEMEDIAMVASITVSDWALQEVFDRNRPFLHTYLQLWAKSGESAPENEVRSIQTWMATLMKNTKEETLEIMKKRLLILGAAASILHNEGEAAEDAAGIYAKRGREEI